MRKTAQRLHAGSACASHLSPSLPGKYRSGQQRTASFSAPTPSAPTSRRPRARTTYCQPKARVVFDIISTQHCVFSKRNLCSWSGRTSGLRGDRRQSLGCRGVSGGVSSAGAENVGAQVMHRHFVPRFLGETARKRPTELPSAVRHHSVIGVGRPTASAQRLDVVFPVLFEIVARVHARDGSRTLPLMQVFW